MPHYTIAELFDKHKEDKTQAGNYIDKQVSHTYIILSKNLTKRRLSMSVYLMLNTLTDAGRKILQEDPEKLREINKEVEYMGVKILDQYTRSPKQ